MATSDTKTEAGGLTRTLKDLFAGAAGGIAQVLLGEYTWRLSCSCFRAVCTERISYDCCLWLPYCSPLSISR